MHLSNVNHVRFGFLGEKMCNKSGTWGRGWERRMKNMMIRGQELYVRRNHEISTAKKNNKLEGMRDLG